MPEWSNGADSKSVGFSLRGFESSSPHGFFVGFERPSLQRSSDTESFAFLKVHEGLLILSPHSSVSSGFERPSFSKNL